MNNEFAYLKIFQYLIESQQDAVEKIITFRKSNKRYPDYVSEFIINILKDKPDLQTIFKTLKESISSTSQLYDQIFNSLIEEENIQITDNENANTDYNDEIELQQQEEENLATEEESTEFNEDDNNINNNLIEEEEIYEQPIDDDDEEAIIGNSYSKDDIFEPSNSDHPIIESKITNIDDNIIDIDEFQRKQQSMIDNISEILYISKDATFLLLKKYNFESYPLFQDFSNQTDFRKSLPKLLNVPESQIDKPLVTQKIGKGECPLCFNENCELIQNYCGHFVCIDCFKLEIEVQIEQGIFPVSCRIDNCRCEIMSNEI